MSEGDASFLLVTGLAFAIGTLVFAYLWRTTKPAERKRPTDEGEPPHGPVIGHD